MTLSEYVVIDRLRGIKNYIDGLRNSPFNPEYGYVFNGKREYEDRLRDIQGLETITPEGRAQIEELLQYVKHDIDLTEEREICPVRTPAEETFYKHIVGVNSYIRETKTKNPGYVFDNVAEVTDPLWKDGCLLDRLEALNTQDPDILSIMHSITADIKIVIGQRFGPEEQGAFQERLDSLNIKLTSRQK